MKPGAVYRLKTATIGAIIADGEVRPLPTIIPAGTVLTVVDDDLGRTGYTHVLWEERIVTMFSIDVRERGERVHGSERRLTKVVR
jgi:hypothetical protein